MAQVAKAGVRLALAGGWWADETVAQEKGIDDAGVDASRCARRRGAEAKLRAGRAGAGRVKHATLYGGSCA